METLLTVLTNWQIVYRETYIMQCLPKLDCFNHNTKLIKYFETKELVISNLYFARKGFGLNKNF